MVSSEYKNYFHRLSYLQYPMFILAISMVVYPLFGSFEDFPTYLNKCLFFLGIGVSFSTLQDTSKTQNNYSKKVWQNSKKGKNALKLMSLIAFIFLSTGFIGLFVAKEGILIDLAFGNLAIGIAYIGVLRSAIEMFDYHQKNVNET